MGIFLWPLMLIPWYVLVWLPFYIVKWVIVVFEFVAIEIPKYMLFGGYDILDKPQIPYAFTFFSIVALVLFFIFLIVAAIRMYKIQNEENKNSFMVAVKHALTSLLLIYLLPFVLLISHTLLNLVTNFILEGTQFNGSNITSEIKSAIAGDVKISNDFDMPHFWDFVNNATQYVMAMMKLALVGLLMGFVFFSVGISLARNAFDLFVLYAISPLILIGSMQDDGKRWKLWKNSYVAKALLNVTFFIGMFLFVIFLKLILKAPLPEKYGVEATIMFQIIAASGATFGFLSFEKMVATFLGESIGVRESLSHLQGTMRTAGMLIAGAGGAVTAGKFAGQMLAKTGKGTFNVASGIGSRMVNGRKDSIGSKLFAAQKSGLISKQDRINYLQEFNESGVSPKLRPNASDNGITKAFNTMNNKHLQKSEIFDYNNWKDSDKGKYFTPNEHEQLEKANIELSKTDYGKSRRAHMRTDDILKKAFFEKNESMEGRHK